jgi:hypothetical protein
MPSALTNIIKCLMICKTKCHIHSKCSKCCEVDIDFEEGPKSLSDSPFYPASPAKENKTPLYNSSEIKNEIKSDNNITNAGAITSNL